MSCWHRLGLDQRPSRGVPSSPTARWSGAPDNPKDVVKAETDWFEGHEPQRLKGPCDNFISSVASSTSARCAISGRTSKFPEIRLRFTPAKGLIYGPNRASAEKCARQEATRITGKILARSAAPSTTGPRVEWLRRPDDSARATAARNFFNETLPPALFAIDPPAPSWLNHNVAISRGYLDDACDGFVEVRLSLPGRRQLMVARARICAGPPAVVPDSLFVRSLADDLDQVLHGPTVAKDEPEAVTRARAARHRAARLRDRALHERRGDERQRLPRPLGAVARLNAGGGGGRHPAPDPPGHVARRPSTRSPSSPCTSRSMPRCAAGRRRGSCACCACRRRSPTSPTAAGARCRR